MFPNHQEELESIDAPSLNGYCKKCWPESSSFQKPEHVLNVSSQECSSVQSLELSKYKAGTQVEVQVQIHHFPSKVKPGRNLPSTHRIFRPGNSVTASRAASNRDLRQPAERIVVLEEQGMLNKRGGKMEVQAEIHCIPSKDKPLSKSNPHLVKPRDRSMNSVRQTCRNEDLQKLAEQIEVLDDQGALEPVIHKEKRGLLSTLRTFFNRLSDVSKKDMVAKSQYYVRRRKNHEEEAFFFSKSLA